MFHYEMFTDKYGYFFQLDIIEKSRTKFQEMVIGNSPVFGKVLLLDGVIQIAENDEMNYHEPIVHYPLSIHPAPKSVLILGGGDGCLAREVLKHRSVRRVVMVDIDGDVVEASKKHFLEINRNPYADRRFEVIIDDAMAYVKRASEKFDVIYMDLVDPVGPGKALYLSETVQTYKNVLNQNGIIISHAQSVSPPHYAAEKFFVKMKGMFRHAHLFMGNMQSFGDLWGFAAFSDGLDFADKRNISRARRRIAKLEPRLRVVNARFIDSTYYLPTWVKGKIAEFAEIEDRSPGGVEFVPTVISAGYKEQMP